MRETRRNEDEKARICGAVVMVAVAKRPQFGRKPFTVPLARLNLNGRSRAA